MTTTEHITTDRQTEIAEAAPHEIGCFEWQLEELTEAAGAEGVDLAGDVHDMWRHRTLASHAHERLAIEPSRCRCSRPATGDDDGW